MVNSAIQQQCVEPLDTVVSKQVDLMTVLYFLLLSLLAEDKFLF